MTNQENDTATSKIALPDKDGLSIYEIKKIVRCTSDNSYTEFLILDDSGNENGYFKKVVSKGIYHFEEYLLSTGCFYRVHNQHIINVNHLKRINIRNRGYVLMDDDTGELIPIARTRKENFLNYLKEKGIII